MSQASGSQVFQAAQEQYDSEVTMILKDAELGYVQNACNAAQRLKCSLGVLGRSILWDGIL